MLTIFRRHTRACIAAHGGKDPGRDPQKCRCKCPISCEGTLGGIMYRRALQTNNWQRAQSIVRDKEARGSWDDPADIKPITIREAVDKFLAEAAGPNRGQSASARRKMISALKGPDENWVAKVAAARKQEPNDGLVDWCSDRGYATLQELTLPVLSEFIAGTKCGPAHLTKRIRVLRRFFWFCVHSGWLQHNPATGLQNPSAREPVTQKEPFDAATMPEPGPEWKGILREIDDWPNEVMRPRFRAIALLMRYTGLRISDAAMFKRDRIMADGMVLVRTTKNGGMVTVPVHPDLKAALSAVGPNPNGFYFASGSAKLTTATEIWRARFSKVFERAGIQGGHPHRFRHTFAVDLLLRNVPIDQVADLLGHRSVAVTRKHYLAYVAGRRQQLQDSVSRAWGLAATA